jgi:hypothetical protein
LHERYVILVLTGALVGGCIGGDARHHPLDLRPGPRIEAQNGLLVQLEPLTSMDRLSASGTMSMIGSPAVITPPTVCTAN